MPREGTFSCGMMENKHLLPELRSHWVCLLPAVWFNITVSACLALAHNSVVFVCVCLKGSLIDLEKLMFLLMLLNCFVNVLVRSNGGGISRMCPCSLWHHKAPCRKRYLLNNGENGFRYSSATF